MANVTITSPSPSPLSPSPQIPPPPSPSPQPQPHPSGSGTKQGRRPTFTTDDDVIIVWEVAAAKAHIARFGEVLKRFAEAAEKANQNPNLSEKVAPKRLQDRYKKLMDAFAKKDARERMMSSVGGELGEVEDLLSAMLDTQRDLEATKNAERTLKGAQENRKEEAGRRLMETAMERCGGNGGAGENGKGRGKRSRMLDGERDEVLEILAHSLRETDMARIEIEREKLALDRDRMEKEVADRAAERDFKREEREARAKVEQDKFKLMMDTFASARK